MTQTPDLLTEIRRFLAAHKLAPSRFGRDAAGDPRFVSDLEKGRSPTERKAKAVRAFMATYPQGAEVTEDARA